MNLDMTKSGLQRSYVLEEAEDRLGGGRILLIRFEVDFPRFLTASRAARVERCVVSSAADFHRFAVDFRRRRIEARFTLVPLQSCEYVPQAVDTFSTSIGFSRARDAAVAAK